MAKEEQNQTTGFEKYAHAASALRLSQSNDGKLYSNGALELLEKNLDFGEDGGDLYRGYIDDGKRDKLIEIYNSKFERKLSEAKISELYSWHESALSGASDEQKELIKSEFDKHAGETYGDLMRKINDLQLDSKKSDEEVREKASKQLEEYKPFLMIQDVLEGYTFESLRQEAVKTSKKENFEGLEAILKRGQGE